MKIVLTDAQTVVDKLVPADRLSQFGEVVQYGLLTYDEVAEKIADADMVICNKTRLDEGSLRLAKNLKYIGLFATGYNNIDIEYCKAHKITVCNAGSYSTNAVAQHTCALILEHYSRVREYAQFVADGQWKRSKTFSPFVYPLNELAGKTIGIVGFGSIGSAVARIAQAFEMRVLAYNRSKKQADGVEFAGFDELLEKNADTVGWIKVEGTKVNYPIVQSSDNDYYLNHAFNGSKNVGGWIFADYRVDFEEFGKNTIIYGHNMNNKTMFGSIPDMLYNSYLNNSDNNFIKISTPDSNSVWKVFSIYTTDPEVYYLKTNFKSEPYETFLTTIKGRSVFDFGIDVGTDDKILTLSTCDNSGTKRVAVHAKMISIEYK